MSLLMLVLLLASGVARPAAQATETDVQPIGAYPFLLPGVRMSPEGSPKILLWCRGARLVGVVVAGGGHEKTGAGAQNRPKPEAFLLRDGRCGADGSLSFGFLVPLKAWVLESPGRGLEERTSWLLQRFEGSVKARRLTGVLVQVNVNHPGYAFQPHNVDVGPLAEEQASFSDESAWRGALARAFGLAESAP